MPEPRGYIVRPADAPGEVASIYPYTLKALLQAMEDARFQSFAGGPQELVKTEGSQQTVIRRYEGGREVPLP